MRQIILDTETTGLSWEQGHRVIEIGCIEMIDRQITENHFHHYINPQRAIDKGALSVHGITEEFLYNKPVFKDILDALIAYIDGAELIIHNAAFDVGFLNHEFKLHKHAKSVTDYCTVVDTLLLARKMHPGQKNNLDALCKRYFISNTHRKLHGALLDAEILARVYLAMTGGQSSLFAETQASQTVVTQAQKQAAIAEALDLPILAANPEELELHQKQLEAIQKKAGGKCLWTEQDTETTSH